MNISIFFSCSDIIQDDISEDSIHLEAPRDSFSTNILNTTFIWETAEGIENYQLQIASPGFENIQSLLLDTLVSSNVYTFTFPFPGNYEWRVKGINNAYETKYSTRFLTVDTNINLSDQLLTILHPIDEFNTTDTLILFSWSSLFSASEYEFYLFDLSSGNNLIDSTISETHLYLDLSEGSFIWRCIAKNSNSSSMYTDQTLFVDRTRPLTPTSLLPLNGDTASYPIEFSWQSDPTRLLDSLFVYSDSMLVNTIESISVTNSTTTILSGTTGTYYWRVKSIDAAGNESSYTSKYKLVIQ